MERVKNILNEIGSITLRMPNWIGDNIMTLPSIYKLIEEAPRAEVKIFCPINIAPVWRGIGLGDKIFAYKNFKDIVELSFEPDLKSDLMIVYPNSFFSALSAYMTGSKIRIGYGADNRNFLLTVAVKKVLELHQVDEYYYLTFQELPKEVLTPRFKINSDFSRNISNDLDMGMKQSKPLIAVLPGAAWGEGKKWFEGNYKDLIIKLGKLKYNILIIGNDEELRCFQEFEQQGDIKLINYSLDVVAYLLSKCDIAIGNDSGLMHIAAAVGCKTIIIYGATDWRRTYPRDGKSYVLSSEMPCQPCWQKRCSRKDYQCLRLIEPKDVINLCVRLLDVTSR